MPMSGMAPPPKSQKPRQVTGAYAECQGRGSRGPSQRSQLNPDGSSSEPTGRSSGRQMTPKEAGDRFQLRYSVAPIPLPGGAGLLIVAGCSLVAMRRFARGSVRIVPAKGA